MRVALYDHLPIDDMTAYLATGHEVRMADRFHPARDADAIITTYTRPPDTGAPIYNLGSHHRHLTHVSKSPVIDLPPWSTHEVVRWTVRHITTAGDPSRVVLVIGRGRIGRRVWRHLRACGWHAVLIGHDHPILRDDRPLTEVGTVTLHVADGRGLLDPALARLTGALVVNSSVRHAITDNRLIAAIEEGHVEQAIIDPGQRIDHPRVVFTGHTAWQGPRSTLLRPLRVLAALRHLDVNGGRDNA